MASTRALFEPIIARLIPAGVAIAISAVVPGCSGGATTGSSGDSLSLGDPMLAGDHALTGDPKLRGDEARQMGDILRGDAHQPGDSRSRNGDIFGGDARQPGDSLSPGDQDHAGDFEPCEQCGAGCCNKDEECVLGQYCQRLCPRTTDERCGWYGGQCCDTTRGASCDPTQTRCVATCGPGQQICYTGEICCFSGEICAYRECSVPGPVCASSSDCDVDSYCEHLYQPPLCIKRHDPTCAARECVPDGATSPRATPDLLLYSYPPRDCMGQYSITLWIGNSGCAAAPAGTPVSFFSSPDWYTPLTLYAVEYLAEDLFPGESALVEISSTTMLDNIFEFRLNDDGTGVAPVAECITDNNWFLFDIGPCE